MNSLGWIIRISPLAFMLALITTASAQTIEEPSPNNLLKKTSAPKEAKAPAKATIQAIYGKIPLHFEANQGQTASRVKFLARGRGYTLFLTPTEAVLALRKQSAVSYQPSAKPEHTDSELETQNSKPETVIRMNLVGANADAEVTGQEELLGKVNYFLGNDPKKWRKNVPTFAKVKYHDLYPGIDLVFYGNQRQLEYDFIVAPGGDPRQIQIEFNGAEKIEVDEQGDLVLDTTGGEVRWQRPRIYQEINGKKQLIVGGYVLNRKSKIEKDSASRNPKSEIENRTVGFQVTAYDPSRTLVIDPVLVYSTYLGGSGEDQGLGIAVDGGGNAYLTGFTRSLNFPTANPLQATLGGDFDIFVTKLNPHGSELVYSTYLGGNSLDQGFGIAVDGAGSAYVTGRTASFNFPTVNPLQPTLAGGFDIFVTKLDPHGSALVYSTYLGGSAGETATAIAVDATGNASVTGQTSSSNFPTANPLQAAYGGGATDAFVAKLNPTGSALVYSTYLGGSNFDDGRGIVVDALGTAFVIGTTNSTNFPTVNPLQPGFAGILDAFVAKLNTEGSRLLYSTYLGGSDSDSGRRIAVDADGNAYVTGSTFSTNFPTANPLQPDRSGFEDAFVTKLNPTGSALVYSTYLGGTGLDAGGGIAVDGGGNAHVTGDTNSIDFPTVDALQPTLGGSFDAFVAKLNTEGSRLLYSTYLGGSALEQSLSIAVDGSGHAYVTGYTDSINFPTENPLQPGFGGVRDAFVAKIRDREPPTVSCAVARALLWPPNHNLVNVGLSVSVSGDDDPTPMIQVRVFGNNGADSSDAADIGPGTLRLRSERGGGGDGRVYLVVVTATDAGGNVAFDVCTAVVPHSQSPAAIAAVTAEATAAEEFYRASQAAPPGYAFIGEGPPI